MSGPGGPVVVRDQAGFDAAAANGGDWIRVDSPPGVWVAVTSPRETAVTASGSATVTAYGSATVRAYDSATVRAYDSATVHASGSATVRAYGSATVTASTHVAVHLHSGTAHIDGGVLIDHTNVDLNDTATWLAYKGVTVTDGRATFYKAVDADLNAGHGWNLTAYPIGEDVTCPDWNPRQTCGGGLHFSPDPHLAHGYYNGDGQPRYLEVTVDIDDIVLLDDKIKARACTVIREVDIARRPVETAEVGR